MRNWLLMSFSILVSASAWADPAPTTCVLRNIGNGFVFMNNQTNIGTSELRRLNNGAVLQLVQQGTIEQLGIPFEGIQVRVLRNPTVGSSNEARRGELLWGFKHSAKADGCDFGL